MNTLPQHPPQVAYGQRGAVKYMNISYTIPGQLTENTIHAATIYRSLTHESQG